MQEQEIDGVIEPDNEALNEGTVNHSHRAPWRALLKSPWLWLVVLAVLGLATPFIPVPNRATALVGAVLATVAYVIAVCLFAAIVTRKPRQTVSIAVGAAISLAIWAALRFSIEPAVFASIAQAVKDSGQAADTGQKLTVVALETAINIALLCAAILGGAVVARLITAPNMLGPVCAIVAMIDIWGVLFGGIVAQMMDKMPEVSRQAMTAAPAVGAASKTAAYAIQPVSIGAGDYLFLGLLFAALHLHRMDWQNALRLTTALIILALLGLMLGPLPMLPGLLFIGLGVAIPNWKYFEYTRDEKFALLYAGIFVVILTVALYFGVTSMLPEKGAS